jgi:hypothetical protein
MSWRISFGDVMNAWAHHYLVITGQLVKGVASKFFGRLINWMQDCGLGHSVPNYPLHLALFIDPTLC